jgi:hypothetical protein
VLKHKTKKLSLDKETLRRLDTSDLRRVHGGVTDEQGTKGIASIEGSVCDPNASGDCTIDSIAICPETMGFGAKECWI